MKNTVKSRKKSGERKCFKSFEGNNRPIVSFFFLDGPAKTLPIFGTMGALAKEEQEQTMFDDLWRGFTEDFQGLTEIERTFKDRPKKHQNLSEFAFLAFLTLKMTLKVKFDLIRPT